MIIESKCKVCGNILKSLSRKYCSRSCYLIDKPNTIKKRIINKCVICGKEFETTPCRARKCCSNICMSELRKTYNGSMIYNYKGGYITNNGYKAIRVNGKYRLEHILVYEKNYGIKVKKGYIVHHINGIKTDNRIENLSLLTMQRHSSLHSRKITDKQLFEIKEMSDKGMTGVQIANVFGIHPSNITRALRGEKVYCQEDVAEFCARLGG